MLGIRAAHALHDAHRVGKRSRGARSEEVRMPRPLHVDAEHERSAGQTDDDDIQAGYDGATDR